MARLAALKTWVTRIAGLVGFVLVLAAWTFYLVKRQFPLFVQVGLGAGLFLLAVVIVLNLGNMIRGLTGQKFRQVLNLALLMTFVFGIFTMAYLVAGKYHRRWDVTQYQRYSLSPQTLQILKDIKTPLKVTCFFQADDPVKQMLRTLLDQYQYSLPGKFSYEFIDPDRNPRKAVEYKLEAYGVLFAESAGRREKTTDPTESALTNAILKLLRNERPVVAFLQGHGEPSLEDSSPKGLSALKEALERDNIVIKPLELMREEKGVPAEIRCVILDSPRTDLLPNEVQAIEQYLAQGGSVLVLTGLNAPPFVKELVKRYGIDLGEDRVVDTLGRLFGVDFTSPLVTQYSEHPITQRFEIASLFPTARSVRQQKTLPEGVQVTELAFSSPNSWAETNLAELSGEKAKLDTSDIKGPISVAVVAEQGITPVAGTEGAAPKTAKLIVYGSSDFVNNATLNFSGNKDLILNTVSWLCGESQLISIRPKEAKKSLLLLNVSQQRLVFFIPVVVMPLAVVALGVIVFVRKRFSR